jgi:putative PIN family toxin of toxin-antitoxin system
VKAVIDACVFVSYLITPRGVGAWLLTLWSEHQFEVVTSKALYAELEKALADPDVTPRIDLYQRNALLRRLRQDADWTPGELDAKGATSDPGDDKLVSAALETGAIFVVTWDSILLDQGRYQDVRFVTPDDFISVVVRQKKQ